MVRGVISKASARTYLLVQRWPESSSISAIFLPGNKRNKRYGRVRSGFAYSPLLRPSAFSPLTFPEPACTATSDGRILLASLRKRVSATGGWSLLLLTIGSQ